MPPALPLLAAAGSISGGLAAVGGTMAGFMGATLGTQLIAGAMIAGGVMTGVGALTGNAKLQKWGGILSLAGGVAGLASGAWTTTANSIAEGAARESFRAAELGAQAAGDVAGAAAGGMADAAGGMLQANMGADMGAFNSATGAAGGAPAVSVMPGAGPVAPGVTAPAIPQPMSLTNAGSTIQTAAKAADSGGMLSSMGDKLSAASDWAQKGNNARLVQAGSGLLQSGLGAYGQAEAAKDQIRMQEEAQARARKRMNDSIQGMNVPVYQRKGG